MSVWDIVEELKPLGEMQGNEVKVLKIPNGDLVATVC